MATTPRIASGRFAARCRAIAPPIERPAAITGEHRAARSVSAASASRSQSRHVVVERSSTAVPWPGRGGPGGGPGGVGGANVCWFFRKCVLRGPILNLLWRPEVPGLDHVPAEGPAILAPNHTSFLDDLLVPLVLKKRRLTILAKADYWD